MKLRVFLSFCLLSSVLMHSQSIDSLTLVPAPAIDSVSLRLKSVQKMEARWYNEAYNNSLYDTLVPVVSNYSYDAIYYPELPTDTLKKRLAILDAKTPFNIAYNPALESVIKRYLKSRKRSTETLINRSQYYFPMFEEVLDKHNLPL